MVFRRFLSVFFLGTSTLFSQVAFAGIPITALLDNGEKIEASIEEESVRLRYPFGTLSVPVNELASLTRCSEERWDVVTVSGNHYRAPIKIAVGEIIDFHRVRILSVNDRKKVGSFAPFSLVLQTGEILPASLLDSVLVGQNSQGEVRIYPKTILDVTVNGGLQGTLELPEGETSLSLTFMNQRYLSVEPLNGLGMLKLPWNLINGIHKANVVGDGTVYVEDIAPHAPAQPLIRQSLVVAVAEIPTIDFYGESQVATDLPKTLFPEDAWLAAEEIPSINFLEKQAIVSNVSFQEESLFAGATDFEIETWIDESSVEKDLKEKKTVQQEEKIQFVSLEEKETGDIAYLPWSSEYQKFAVEEEVMANEEPSMMSYIEQGSETGPFYIQNKKVTNQEYQEFVEAVNYPAPRHWVKGKVPRGQEDFPVVNVSYKDALLFSIWKGKRLPTQKELTLAHSKKRLSSERGNARFEWTSSPSNHKESVASLSARIGGYASLQHFVFGSQSSESVAMENQHFNANTGFRLASDAP